VGVTNAGKALFADLVGNVTGAAHLTYIAYGNNTTAFAATQTALIGTESQRAAATVTRVTTTVANDTLQLAHTFSITSTETIGECGTFNAASSGTMATRNVLSPTRSVVSGDSWTGTVKIQFA
jgi:hypothetical protein